MLSCVCMFAVVAPLLVVGQYQPYPGQGYPGQPTQQDYNQPLTATNYQADGHQRTESVDNQGNVKGQYSYVDPNGKTITVKYTAGKDGFQVEGDHLPRSPVLPSAEQQYQPQQYQPQQYQPQQYQSQQYQPQQYQPQQYQPQQYHSQQYQPQEYQPQSQTSFQGFPQNRFSTAPIPAGVSVSQNPNGGFTYSYSPSTGH